MEFTVVNYLWRKEYQQHQERAGSQRSSPHSSSRNVMLSQTTTDPNHGKEEVAPAVVKGGQVSSQSAEMSSPTSPGNIKVSIKYFIAIHIY
jgi:hypothetical protein